jgi:hypothetical protein
VEVRSRSLHLWTALVVQLASMAIIDRLVCFTFWLFLDLHSIKRHDLSIQHCPFHTKVVQAYHSTGCLLITAIVNTHHHLLILYALLFGVLWKSVIYGRICLCQVAVIRCPAYVISIPIQRLHGK